MLKDALHYLPLGGTGEIGMNLNLYHCNGRWLMVDCGVMFERDGDRDAVLHADAAFIQARRDQLEAMVITHVHQDHFGAVVDLWPKLRCPVYCTRFTAAMLSEALAERGLLDDVPLNVIDERAKWKLGPFSLTRIPLTHSTAEMGGLLISTPYGMVLHTGDWKLDPEPLVGRACDEKALRALGHHDLLACVSDSTNADQEGWTGSESALVGPLTELLANQPGRVAVTLFSTNLARMQTLLRAGLEAGRYPVIVGRSIERTLRAAQQAGYLLDFPTPTPLREFGWLPREGVLLLCTGSQGEPQAGLGKLATDARTDVYLEPGDTVLFSSRCIPGNEQQVDRLLRLLRQREINVVTDNDANIHVSGHPRRDELRQLYGWTRPRYVVPTHGTPSKLEAHAELAESLDLGAVRVRNGDLLQLAPGEPRIVERIPTGRVARVEPERTPRQERWRPRKSRANHGWKP